MMKFYTLCLSLLMLALYASPAWATSIAVVDTRVLMSDSKASEDISKQLEGYRDEVLKELSAKEKSLIEEEKKLVELKKTAAEDEFIKKAKEFEKKRIEFQKSSANYRQKLNTAALEAEKSLMEKVVQIVAQIAAEKKYDLVITKQNVITGAVSIDLTDDVMKALNKEVPTYKIEYKK